MQGTSKKSPDSKWFILAVLSTLAAILIHGYLTYRHFQISYGDATSSSICNMSETYNCDAVAASEYSSFMGIPLALWGFVTNLILLVLALVYKLTWKENDLLSGRLTVYLSGSVLLMSVVMGLVSLTQLTVYCPFCIAAYVLSLISFIGFFLSVEGPVASKVFSDSSLLLISRRGLLVLFLAIPAFSWLFNGILNSQYQQDPERLKQFVKYQVNEWQQAKTQDFSHLRGLQKGADTDKALMTIHEFADFRCGHCRSAAPKLHAFTKSHSDVRLVFLTFPLDGACNSNISRPTGISCRLAKAVFCAGDNGWKFHDHIFEHQAELSNMSQVDVRLKEIAEATSVDMAELEKCIESESMDQEIRRQVDAANNAGVKGTPAVFVNGKILVGGQNLNLLKEVYSSIKKN